MGHKRLLLLVYPLQGSVLRYIGTGKWGGLSEEELGRNREPSQDEDDDPWLSTLAIAPNLGPESSSYPRIVIWHSKENFKKFRDGGVSPSQYSRWKKPVRMSALLALQAWKPILVWSWVKQIIRRESTCVYISVSGKLWVQISRILRSYIRSRTSRRRVQWLNWTANWRWGL